MKQRRNADFDALFLEHYHRVVAIAAAIVDSRETAEDVAQDAFAEALVRWSRLSTYERPDLWIIRVAKQRAWKVARGNKRLLPLNSDDREGSQQPDSPAISIHRELMQLSPSQRATIVMHDLYGYRFSEIGRVLGCSEATVRVHLHRGRRRLIKTIGEASDAHD